MGTPSRSTGGGVFRDSPLPALSGQGQELVERPLNGPEDLESWVVDWSSWVSEVRTWWHGRQALPRMRLEAARQVNEALQPLHLRIARRLVEHPAARMLPREEFAQLLRRARTDVNLDAPGLALLRSQESALLLEADGLRASRDLVFRGQRLPVSVVEGTLERGNLGRREVAWWTLGHHQQRNRQGLDRRLDTLLQVRTDLARTAGFQNYPAFRWLELRNFSWGPDEARALIDGVARVVVPRLRRWQRLVRQSHGLRHLRPWDGRLEPGSPLSAMRDPNELARRCLGAFDRVHPAFGAWFQWLLDQGLADLSPGSDGDRRAWQAHSPNAMPQVRVPFTGGHGDVVRVLHESGHAFHALARQGQRLVHNRAAPTAFAEVSAHTMELIGSQHLAGTVYSREDAVTAQLRSLGRVVKMLCGLARVEAFQFWLHDHPDHGPRAREAAWSGLGQRFDGYVDWTGLERARGQGYLAHRSLWQDPFGQLPYAVALVGALQVWAAYCREPEDTLERFRQALALGWSRDLAGLFEVAEIRLDLSRGMLNSLMCFWDVQVEKLTCQLRSGPRIPLPSIARRSETEAPV